MKVTEIKLSRLFNTGNRESHTISLTLQVDEDIEMAFNKAHELIWKLNEEMQNHTAFKFEEAVFYSTVNKVRNYLIKKDKVMANYHFEHLKYLADSQEKFVIPEDIINAFKP